MGTEDKYPKTGQDIPNVDPSDFQDATERVLSSGGITVPEGVFANFDPNEHPPYDQFIMDEAQGNLGLADLIEKREITYFDMRAAGLDEKPVLMQQYDALQEVINAKKIELNLEDPRD